jgi:hypothetical protein
VSKGQERDYSNSMFCFGVHVLSVALIGFNLFIGRFVKTLRACSLLCKYVSLNKGYLLGSVKEKKFAGFMGLLCTSCSTLCGTLVV